MAAGALKEELKDSLLTTETALTVDNSAVNKHDLRVVLQDTQCPLMPSKYGQSGELCSAFYFNGELWRLGDGDCRIIEFESEALKRKAMDECELMMAVDEYISYVHINKSTEIYSKLNTANLEAGGVDDGDDSNDEYQKLIPSVVARIMFVVMVMTSALNCYAVINGFIVSIEFGYDSKMLNQAAIVMSVCEMVLLSNILLSDVLVNTVFLSLKLLTGDTVFLESKLIATELRSLSTLSILRYLPSVELMTSYFVRWRETLSTITAKLLLLCRESNDCECSVRTNWFKRVFSVPVYLVETAAPFLALFAILVKIQEIEFAAGGSPMDWSLTQLLAFIAFLNQVAGLRVLRNVEAASIQHFVFSGADATMDTDELLLIDNWWNITVLSAVSNLKMSSFDNMVFWSSLDPQKIQLLLKNHVAPGGDDDVLKKAKDCDQILDDYDQRVFRMLEDRKIK